MHSNGVRIVANHHRYNITKIFATQTPQLIICTIISLTSFEYEESIKINHKKTLQTTLKHWREKWQN